MRADETCKYIYTILEFHNFSTVFLGVHAQHNLNTGRFIPFNQLDTVFGGGRPFIERSIHYIAEKEWHYIFSFNLHSFITIYTDYHKSY